jgi:hypothetical protein
MVHARVVSWRIGVRIQSESETTRMLNNLSLAAEEVWLADWLNTDCWQTLRSNVPCRYPAHESQFPAYFVRFIIIQLVRINKTKFENVYYNIFGLLLGSLHICLLRPFFENRCRPPTGLLKQTKLPLRRHDGLRTRIPGLEATFLGIIKRCLLRSSL